ncbi:MAG: aminotransferase class IV [Prolixibacteraceae bacterium]|nr:aminotransferase class IV [Prolixibacteraceae bacterium]MBN2775490.1 aminotransferase class IV [Prolixibacteraceae bacterium]
MKEQLEFTGFRIPELLTDQRELKRLSSRLINKNKAFLSGLLNLTVLSNHDDSHLIITVEPSDKKNFELKNKGKLLDFSDQLKYSANEGNKYRFYNLAFWNSSQKTIRDLKIDGLIFLNENKSIVECANSNIYFIKGNALISPSPETGCYLDLLREKVLETAAILNFRIIETSQLSKSDIDRTDEAFIAGESIAMQKITGIGNIRFTHQKTQMINEKLNEILLND